MTVDWNSKSTYNLELTLGALIKYKNNAKTDREKRNRDRNIEAISKILRERKNANQQSI